MKTGYMNRKMGLCVCDLCYFSDNNESSVRMGSSKSCEITQRQTFI